MRSVVLSDDIIFHMTTHVKEKALWFDVSIIVISIIFAIILARSGSFHDLISFSGYWIILGAFVAGLLFTSVFTIPIAIAGLISLAEGGFNPWLLAALGACGAVIADRGLLSFIKGKIVPDIAQVLSHTRFRRFVHITRRRWFRIMSPVVGALIIASPLPDELGITLMGLSKIRIASLIPILYVMNFLGILIIAAAAYTI